MSFKTFTQQYFLHAEPKRPGESKDQQPNRRPRLSPPTEAEDEPPQLSQRERHFIIQQLSKLSEAAADDNWSADKLAFLGTMTDTFHAENIEQLKRMCNTMLKHFPESPENATIRTSLKNIMQGPLNEQQTPRVGPRTLPDNSLPAATGARSPPASPRAAASKLQEGDHVRLQLSDAAKEIEGRNTRGEGDLRKEIKKIKTKLGNEDVWCIGGGLHKHDVYVSLHQENGKGDGKRTQEWAARKSFVNMERVNMEDLSQEDKSLFDNSVAMMKTFGGAGHPFNDNDINLAALNNVKKTATQSYDKLAKKATAAIFKSAVLLTKEGQFERAIDQLNKIEEKSNKILKQIDLIKELARQNGSKELLPLSSEAQEFINKADQAATEADIAYDQIVYDSSKEILVETWAIRAGIDIMRKGTRFEIQFDDEWYAVTVVVSDPETLTITYQYTDKNNLGNIVRFTRVDTGEQVEGEIYEETATSFMVKTSTEHFEIEKDASEVVVDAWANANLMFLGDVFRFPTVDSDTSMSEEDICEESSSSDESSEEDDGENDCCFAPGDLVVVEDPQTDEYLSGIVTNIDMSDELNPLVEVQPEDSDEKAWFPIDKVSARDDGEDEFDEEAAKQEDQAAAAALAASDDIDSQAMPIGSVHMYKTQQVTIDSKPYLPSGAKKDEDSEHYWVLDSEGKRISVPAVELDEPEEEDDEEDDAVSEQVLMEEDEESAEKDAEEEENLDISESESEAEVEEIDDILQTTDDESGEDNPSDESGEEESTTLPGESSEEDNNPFADTDDDE
jgi:hypothetical protein